MDYIFKAIGIAFLVTVILFIYNALKIQHGSGHFPNQKDDSEKSAKFESSSGYVESTKRSMEGK